MPDKEEIKPIPGQLDAFTREPVSISPSGPTGESQPVRVQIEEVPSLQNEPTDDPNLYRVVDRAGDWTHYFQSEVERYMPAVNHIITIGFPKGQGLIEWIKRTPPEEAERRLRTAGERGAKAHAGIRDLIDGQTIRIEKPYMNDAGIYEPLKPDEWDCLLSFQAWAKTFSPQVQGHENALWHRKYFYAGTRDFKGLITIPKGTKLSVDNRFITWPKEKTVRVNPLDWKTGGSYEDHKLQVASYNACDPTPYDFTGIVRLGTTHQNGGYEMRLWSREYTARHFQAFMMAKQTYHFLTGRVEWKPPVVQIPLSITVPVPQVLPPKQAAIKKAVDEKKQVIGEAK